MDEAVDAGVDLHEGLPLGRLGDLFEHGDQPVGLLAVDGRHPLRGSIGGVALELDPQVGDLCEVGDVDVGDERPAARVDRDEVLERKSLDRLANGRPTDAELADKRILVDRQPGRELQRQDPVANRDVRTVGEERSGPPIWALTDGNVFGAHGASCG